MKTVLITSLLLCGIQTTLQAQLAPPPISGEPSTSDKLRKLLGEDFFSLPDREAPRRRPRATTVAPPSRGYQWDYRFDAQYQSTVKPYLRWYMRADPSNPGDRYLPRYMTSQGYGNGYGYGGYGYGSYGQSYGGCGVSTGCGTGGCSVGHGVAGCSTGYGTGYTTGQSGCSTCGGSYGYPSYGYGHGGYQPRSNYWRHLDYLYQMHGESPQRPRRLGARLSDQRSTTVRRSGGTKTKTVWLTRNEKSKAVSILFVTPPASQKKNFYKAKAELTAGMKIASIEWENEPDWSDEVEVADTNSSDKSKT